MDTQLGRGSDGGPQRSTEVVHAFLASGPAVQEPDCRHLVPNQEIERRSEHNLETLTRVRLRARPGGRRSVYLGVKEGQRLTVFIENW